MLAGEALAWPPLRSRVRIATHAQATRRREPDANAHYAGFTD